MKILLLVSFFLLIVSLGCNSASNSFLDNFKEVDDIPLSTKGCYVTFDITDTIPKKELISTFLLSLNELNDSLIGLDRKFYYGFRYKISNDLFLISYTSKYRTIGNYHNVLLNPFDITFCLYRRSENRVTSKLIVCQSDPIFRRFEYEKGLFKVFSKSYYFNYSEKDNKDSMVNIYDNKVYVIKEDTFHIR